MMTYQDSTQDSKKAGARFYTIKNGVLKLLRKVARLKNIANVPLLHFEKLRSIFEFIENLFRNKNISFCAWHERCLKMAHKGMM